MENIPNIPTPHSVIDFSQISGINYTQTPEELNSHATALLKNIGCTSETLERRVKFQSKIQYILALGFPEEQVSAQLFGSSFTGLDFDGSDCDIVLVTEPKNTEINIYSLADLFRTVGMKDVVVINNAKVPIVKFQDPHHNISCDISINNLLGLYNSQMIKAYLSIDNRVKELIMLIKYWAKRRNINSSKHGTYSSYCYVLMAIFFLQQLDEPILPSLQQISLDLNEEGIIISIPTSYRTKPGRRKLKTAARSLDISYFRDIDALPLLFKKPADLTRPSPLELFFHFCLFYTRVISTSKSTISVRTGNFMPMKNAWLNHKNRLYVEDPFDLERNVACSSNAHGEKKLMGELERVVVLFGTRAGTLEKLFTVKQECSTHMKRRLSTTQKNSTEALSDIQPESISGRNYDTNTKASESTKFQPRLNQKSTKSSRQTKVKLPNHSTNRSSESESSSALRYPKVSYKPRRGDIYHNWAKRRASDAHQNST